MVWWTCPDDSKKVWQFYVDLILFAISLINGIKKKSYWQLFSHDEEVKFYFSENVNKDLQVNS